MDFHIYNNWCKRQTVLIDIIVSVYYVYLMETEYSTMRVRTETYDRLKTFGKYGDSVDKILNRLMDTESKKQK